MKLAAAVFFLLAILLAILLVRFCKRRVAAFHRAVTNRIAIRFAARLPGFAIVTNVGRKSGRLYRTPVNVFREPDGFLIALTYGQDSGWVGNVLAAGGCQLETRRVAYQLSSPVIVHDPSRQRFPLLVRIVLGLIDANDFLKLSTSHYHGAASEVRAGSGAAKPGTTRPPASPVAPAPSHPCGSGSSSKPRSKFPPIPARAAWRSKGCRSGARSRMLRLPHLLRQVALPG